MSEPTEATSVAGLSHVVHAQGSQPIENYGIMSQNGSKPTTQPNSARPNHIISPRSGHDSAPSSAAPAVASQVPVPALSKGDFHELFEICMSNDTLGLMRFIKTHIPAAISAVIATTATITTAGANAANGIPTTTLTAGIVDPELEAARLLIKELMQLHFPNEVKSSRSCLLCYATGFTYVVSDYVCAILFPVLTTTFPHRPRTRL
jgi:hypothetical protein